MNTILIELHSMKYHHRKCKTLHQQSTGLTQFLPQVCANLHIYVDIVHEQGYFKTISPTNVVHQTHHMEVYCFPYCCEMIGI